MTHKIKIVAVVALMFSATGCFKDLDTIPLDPDVLTAEAVFKNPASYKQYLAKIYAGLAVSGQQGPAGQADISGIDEGFGQYLRGYWYHQELPTDEAVIGWNDQTIKDFHAQAWTESDGFIYAFYSRIFYQISLANEYLRETTDAKLDGRGVDANLKNEIKRYRAEARFMRALSYWHALDLFRNVPFATEADIPGAELPKQTNANDLFSFIESELLAIDAELAAPRSNEYGRADKAAAWMLLAKLYLNAEVYTGQNRYGDCLRYCESIINAGYELEPDYQKLFMIDNENSDEVIFSVNFDGINTRTWGGMTFIIRAGIGGSMNPVESGVVSGWGGTRTTRQLIEKFPSDLTGIKVDFNPGANYPKIYIRGTFQDTPYDYSDGESALATTNSATKIYEGHFYFPDNNTELLVAQYPGAGTIKFGDNGANGSLETNGSPIVVPEAGLYYIMVNLANKTYVIEKRNWTIIGTATGGSPVNLDWSVEDGMLVGSSALTAGSFSFEANAGGVVLGDTGADALLDANGDEIVIDQAGTYKVFLDINRPDYTYQLRLTSFDRRGIFYTDGQNLDINDLTLFTEGYAVRKFKNIRSDGTPGKDSDFPDTDFPMFRLADAYLMAAEAILRGAGGGDKNQAAVYFNKVRERAFTGASGNFTPANLTLDVILDERARELYWECQRRTDLIRFGKFTDGNYLWAWKGGVKDGQTVPNFRNIYPIPSADRGANPNLQQNPGY